MGYKLIITEKAEELLTKCIDYLVYRLKNREAALHLLDNIQEIYDRLEENPRQFPECMDEYLSYLGYREAVLPDMRYVVIYKIEDHSVYILGVFHELEQYRNKL